MAAFSRINVAQTVLTEAHFHKAIVDGCEDAIVGMADDAIVIWNRAAEDLFGYAFDEVIGRPVSMLIPAERERELPELLDRLRQGEHIRCFETERLHRDGRRVPVSLTLSPVIAADGTFEGVCAIARDIAERQRADQLLRAREAQLRDVYERERFALDVARIGVWEADLRTGVADWSPMCETLHGLAAGTFGKTFEAFIECVHPDDRTEVLRAIHQAQETRTAAEIQYRVAGPKGAPRWLQCRSQFAYGDGGKAIRAAGVCFDITERRQLEDQLRQAQKMEAIGQLAGGVAHDFNNMLTAILGNAEFVLDELPVGDPRRVNLDEVRSAAKRAAVLTQQLLAFGRKQILSPRVLRLGDVVNGILPMLGRLLGESIDLDAATYDTGRTKADAIQIEQIIMNLAVNARDAMPGGGRLTIETADVTLDDDFARENPNLTPGTHVMLAVTDNGCGMDAATQRHVFEPFFTTKALGKGTGLGLATVYGIVKQSGGHIQLQSAPGCGTTFKVFLPTTEEGDVITRVEPVRPRPLRGNETVLLVEDEDAVRKFVHRVLERQGYTVHAVADPRTALESISPRVSTLHLVVTDVVLPDMNGRAMATAIRERHPESRVLYISGYADDGIVQDGTLEKGTRFLAKPFSAEALARAVRDVLE